MNRLFAFNVAEPLESVADVEGSYDSETQLWRGRNGVIAATGCTAPFTTQSCIRTAPSGNLDCVNRTDCGDIDVR